MVIVRKTKATINNKAFEIAYQKKEDKEGVFFEGKIFFANNTILFSFFKKNNSIFSFKPELSEKKVKVIIAAIEQKESEA